MNRALKWIVGTIIVIILILVAVYFTVVPGIEKGHAERIRAEIARIPGYSVESVKVGFLSKTVEMTGLKMSSGDSQGLMNMDCSINHITISGYNLKAHETPGVNKLADEMLFEGLLLHYDIRFEDMPEMEFKEALELKELRLRDVHGDYMKALEILNRGKLGMAGLMEMGGGFRIGYFQASQYKAKVDMFGQTVNYNMESAEGENVTIYSCGKGLWKNMTVETDGVNVAIKEIGIGRMLLPDMIQPLIEILEGGDPEESSKAIMDIFTEQPTVLKDFLIKDISIKIQDMPAWTIGLIGMDFASDPEQRAAHYKFRLGDLTLPAEIYGGMGSEGESLAAIYGKPLVIGANLDGQAKRDGERIEINIADVALTEKDLASLNVAMNILLLSQSQGIMDFFDHQLASFMENMVLTFEDKGLLDIWFAMEGKADDMSVEQVRAMYMDALKIKAGDVPGNPSAQALLSALLKLLEGPGKLRVEVNPAQPVGFDSIDEADLNCTAEFTPALSNPAERQ